MAQNLVSRYTVEIYTPLGNLLADLSGIATVRQFSLVRNGAGSASFKVDLPALETLCRTINVNPRDLLSVNHNEIKIRRGSTYLYGGQINYHEALLGRNQTIEVRAIGFLDLLANRYITTATTYTSIDAGAIAWDLIDTVQSDTNGNFGITQGTIQTSVTRTRTYDAYKNIKEMLVKLTDIINGFDMEITYDKVFNVYYPQQGSVQTNILFEYPGNIKEVQIPTDGSLMVNKALMRGKGYGVSQLTSTQQDTTYQTYYNIREKIYDYPDVSIQATLDDYGSAYVAQYKDLIQIPQITVDGNVSPFLGDYGLGDRVRVSINGLDMYNNIQNDYYKIDAINVSISENDEEDIRLTLSLP